MIKSALFVISAASLAVACLGCSAPQGPTEAAPVTTTTQQAAKSKELSGAKFHMNTTAPDVNSIAGSKAK